MIYTSIAGPASKYSRAYFKNHTKSNIENHSHHCVHIKSKIVIIQGYQLPSKEQKINNIK